MQYVTHGRGLFQIAIEADALGLNWRMCVVDMTAGSDGSCCTDTDESGDRWLTAGNPGDDQGITAYGMAILSTDPESCAPDSSPSPPMGYKQLIEHTGGILASLCQTDLTTTMTLLIEDMAGAASSLSLAHTPIPVSLAVAMERKDPQDGSRTGYEALPRSRTSGFNYRASTNRIVLVGQAMDYPPYEVVVSYSRWVTPVAGPD